MPAPAPGSATTLPLGDGRALPLQPFALMGVLNVTPDSFSDGGQHDHVDAAVAHARQMLDAGAAIIDIGGESTRPGAARVNAAEQKRRVVPVIEALRPTTPKKGSDPFFVSVDTTRADVAAAALDAGADLLNDVSAGREDPDMLHLAADRGVPIVLMHMLGEPGTMQQDPRYDDVVTEVLNHLLRQADAAMAAGVPRDQIVLDPGIGFGKTLEHNLQLLAHLDRLVATGHPVLLGPSRKRFIQMIDPTATNPAQRGPGTLAACCHGLTQGVPLFRVHDVAEARQALAVTRAVTHYAAAS
jgi:dihydropteroate synthase